MAFVAIFVRQTTKGIPDRFLYCGGRAGLLPSGTVVSVLSVMSIYTEFAATFEQGKGDNRLLLCMSCFVLSIRPFGRSTCHLPRHH